MRLIDADRLETHEQLEPLGNGNYEYVKVVYKDDIDSAPTIPAIELGVEYDTNKYDITISMNSGEREVDDGHSKLFVVRESTFKVEKRE